jgi:hypothetical protein
MAKLVGNKKKNLSIITQPWFVIVVVISCFGILTPKIFMPLFRQITGGSTSSSNNNHNTMPHNMRPMRGPGPRDHGPGSDGARSSPHFGGRGGGGGPQPAYAPQQSQSSNSKSMLSFLLPVYATGIGLYMIYTLFKVFNKSDDDDQDKKNYDDEQDEEEFEANKTNNYKFKENSTISVSSNAPSSNVRWDPDDGQFKYVNGTAVNRFQKMSEESEDELTDYERYKNLDPEYVEFLKHKRRLKREEENALAKTKKASLKTDEISLSPGSGLTSITNTNVLMNDTLERMKHSLNKINNQLIQVESKGSPLDDPELENLRIQLTQTELQMAKIMNIVNSVSTTIQQTPPSPPTPPPPPPLIEQDTELDDQAELECLQRQVEMIKLAVSKTETKSNKINRMKNKKSKNSSSANKQVYEKIKQNISVAEQLLRKRNTNKTESQVTPDKVNSIF